MAKVSIAVPAYNCEKYISQSLDSLLGQTYGDFELVISDNASSDDTEEICRRYIAMDKRVRYIRRTENIGGPGNFRYVFAQCSGQYHKWSTADDFWHPEFLAEAVAVLDRRPDVVLCYPKTRLIDATGAALSDYEDRLDLADDSPRARFRALYELIGLCNAHLGLIRRDAMLQTRLIAAHKASDVDFLGELALLGKFKLLPDVRFYRRFHEDSSSWARDDKAAPAALLRPEPTVPRAAPTPGVGCASNGRCCGAVRSDWPTNWRCPRIWRVGRATSAQNLSRELWGQLRQTPGA